MKDRTCPECGKSLTGGWIDHQLYCFGCGYSTFNDNDFRKEIIDKNKLK